MDNVPDTRGDNSAPANPVTSTDTLPAPDTSGDSHWGHIPDDEDGSTWEVYQDDGAYPSWV